MAPHTRLIVSLGLALALPACALDGDGDAGADDATEASHVYTTTPGAWYLSYSNNATSTWQGPQVATLNGVTYMVTAGECGAYDCFNGYDQTQLRFTTLGPSGLFAPVADIPNQSTHGKVSLAAFNGYLYMAHIGGSDNDQGTTFISRYNPATNSWSPDHAIAYPSFGGPPAIAAYNNRLYFIGTQGYPYQMWYGSMDTAENFTPMYTLAGHDTASRPSAAVAFGKLFFAHRWGQTGDIVYGTFDGTTWSGATHIYGGDSNGAIQGLEPALAYSGNRLYLAHRRPNDTFVWWTAYDNCGWSTSETQVAGLQGDLEPSLADTANGLVLTTPHQHTDVFSALDHYAPAYALYRNSSPLPPVLANCNIVFHPF